MNEPIVKEGFKFPNERTIEKIDNGFNWASPQGYFGPCQCAVLSAWTSKGIQKQIAELGIANPRFEVIRMERLGSFFPRVLIVWTEAMDRDDLDKKAKLARRVQEEIEKEEIAQAKKEEEALKEQDKLHFEEKKKKDEAEAEVRRLVGVGEHCEKIHKDFFKKLKKKGVSKVEVDDA